MNKNRPPVKKAASKLGRLIRRPATLTLTKWDWRYLALVTIIFAIVYSAVYDEKIDLNGDNVNYYLLGKAIAAGKGYVVLSREDEPKAHHFPPGYPAIIAAVMTLVSPNLVVVKVANGLFLVGSVWLLYLLILRITNDRNTSLVISVLILLNTHFLRSATIMMSEIPFFFFSMLAFYLFTSIKLEENPIRNPVFYAFLFCLSLTYYIRTAGIAIFGGILLYLLLKKQWRFLACTFSGYVLLAVPWIIRGRSLGGNAYLLQLVQVNPYRPELGTLSISSLVIRIFNNISRYITKEIPNGLFPFIPINYQQMSFPGWILGLVILALIGYGVYRLAPQYRLLVLGYLVGTFSILLLWPDVWFGVRFLLPAIPFLLLGLIVGLENLIRLGMNRLNVSWRFSSLVFLVLLIFYYPAINGLRIQARAPYPRNWQNYFHAAIWLGKNSSPDVVVSCRKPGMFYFFSNRHCVSYPYTLDDQVMLDSFVRNGVDFVVLDQLGYASTSRYLYPAILKHQEKFPVIQQYKNPDTYLLAFRP
ncbi:MAG: phospholipid carrier-dependent glycosyltransferase [Fidelibacterota bacterium]|nr:MAG: phospholipid carrier-dependent glycosyltransferase [Candidatus Neomarinimicrobiota bacterium]